MLSVGEPEVTYLKNGNARYQIELSHRGLRKHRVIKGDDPGIVRRKADLQVAEWQEKWNVQEGKAREEKRRLRNQSSAEAQTKEAQAAIRSVETLLAHTLTLDDTIDWASLKSHALFATPRPSAPEPPEPPRKPEADDQRFQPKLGLFDKLIPSRRRRRIEEATRLYETALAAWRRAAAEAAEAAAAVAAEHERAVAEWETAKQKYEQVRDAANDAIDAHRLAYLAGDPDALVEYCELVLSRSHYPDSFPQEFDLSYNCETKVLVVDYLLPALEDLPTLKQVTYVKSRGELKEKHLTDRELNKLYDDALYQIALRTIHELYESDRVEGIDSVAFNGFVQTIDRGTGREIQPCVLSVQAPREAFLAIDLHHVEPKSCFKSLKGVGSSKLHSMTPVAPLVTMSREDSRFVDSYGVAADLDETTNVAAMDWEDFEHLIRELFEKEFAQGGGEVKVTQASRDGGVDAIAFDPDPIRGGKIVIQAKRYTNTVGVAAVRDLYGTVVNEGATKGILVTTSDFGPDAYNFANGKPLTLLNGGNLLHLLERHGHKARIDIAEARGIAAGR